MASLHASSSAADPVDCVISIEDPAPFSVTAMCILQMPCARCANASAGYRGNGFMAPAEGIRGIDGSLSIRGSCEGLRLVHVV
jgi:hypothetical protein